MGLYKQADNMANKLLSISSILGKFSMSDDIDMAITSIGTQYRQHINLLRSA